jgi:hypothetical protein
MKTGNDVRELGLYSSECCLQEILFDAGDSFSRCPRCSNLCDWEVVDVASSLQEMRDLKESAGIEKQWASKGDSLVLELRHSL